MIECDSLKFDGDRLTLSLLIVPVEDEVLEIFNCPWTIKLVNVVTIEIDNSGVPRDIVSSAELLLFITVYSANTQTHSITIQLCELIHYRY